MLRVPWRQLSLAAAQRVKLPKAGKRKLKMHKDIQKKLASIEHLSENTKNLKRRSRKQRQRLESNEKWPKSADKFNKLVDATAGSLQQANPLEKQHIPKLAHALDRVLFSPGVHFLQDPRTRIYNFTPYLKKIISINDFDFTKVQGFVQVSLDTTLLDEAIRLNKRFYSSTSSMTLTLTQFYLFLNNYLSYPDSKHRFDFPAFSRTLQMMPSSVIVQPKGVNPKTQKKVFSVSADKSTSVEILLGAMGHALEALLTNDENEFKLYLFGDETPQKDQKNVYNYLTYGSFLMRSQLDCYDPRLPGNGTFDLKTRAVCSIRYDKALDALSNAYQIWKLRGQYESFEREYNDLIKTGGLLKYMFQARIGQMDGIFVAYHNVNTFFGFEYLPLSELDRVFYSDANTERFHELPDKIEEDLPDIGEKLPSFVAETQFKASIAIWEDIMETAIKDLGETAFRLVLKWEPHRTDGALMKEPKQVSRLRVFAVPLKQEKIHELQDFSTKFKTSFREDLTPEERANNLDENRKQLDAFNQDLVAKTPVFEYVVEVLHRFGDKKGSIYSQNYPRRQGPWLIDYRVKRVKGDSESVDGDSAADSSKNLYLKLLSVASSMLSQQRKPARGRTNSLQPNSVETMRKYSDIGRLRAERWAEFPELVYRPL